MRNPNAARYSNAAAHAPGVIPAKAGIHSAVGECPHPGVIPAQAGIQWRSASLLDPGLRRDDA